jgi:hypothetical protein
VSEYEMRCCDAEMGDVLTQSSDLKPDVTEGKARVVSAGLEQAG